MDNKVSEIIVTLSSLYELLLKVGQSFDIEENAETFLRALMLQKNLSFAAYYKLANPDSMIKVYSIPKTRITKSLVDSKLMQHIAKHQYSILKESNPQFEWASCQSQLLQKEYVVYFAGSKSILLLGKKNDIFKPKELLKYELVLNKFCLFMESLESHHQIKDEIKIKEQQAQTIIQTNEKLTKQNDVLIKYIRSNNELEKFAYQVSHDLKAPLRTIVGFSNMITRSSTDNLTESQKEFLNFIIDAGTQMGNLISGILDYSKINGEGLVYKRINMYQLIDKIRNLLHQSLTETNGKITIKEIPEFIVADENKVKQLLLNLISNSIKFRKRELNPEIIIAGKTMDDDFEFSISDNGMGIPEECKDKIFDIFSRAHIDEGIEGQGIGLSICRQIINQHQGDIWVKSELNKGTSFYFTIQKVSLPAEVETLST